MAKWKLKYFSSDKTHKTFLVPEIFSFLFFDKRKLEKTTKSHVLQSWNSFVSTITVYKGKSFQLG